MDTVDVSLLDASALTVEEPRWFVGWWGRRKEGFGGLEVWRFFLVVVDGFVSVVWCFGWYCLNLGAVCWFLFDFCFLNLWW